MPTLRQRILEADPPRLLAWLFIAQIFTVFFTGVRFLPGIRNNLGPFEIVGALLIGVYLSGRVGQLRLHGLNVVQALILLLAAASLLWYQGGMLRLGIIQTVVLAFQLLFVLVTYNFMLDYQVSPEKLLRLVTYSALIIGPWILITGLGSDQAIQTAGPFRNRAHMATYMLTAFWLVLIFNSWPGIKKRDRLLSYLALASTLYPIAVSGRRSVYLSLIFGLIGIGLSFVVAARGRRFGALLATSVVFGAIGLMYIVGPRWMPQLEFFQGRVGGIGSRLEMAVSIDNSDPGQDFFAMQRAGVRAAYLDYPLTGIGWGGFYNSRYSISGHEVHSTPLRFLAELGLIGLGLYVAMMAILLLGSLRLVVLLRSTAYRTSAVTLAIAVWSLSISFAYNRHITERTFWLLMLFYVTFEAFARGIAQRQRSAAARAPGIARRPPVERAAAMARPG